MKRLVGFTALSLAVAAFSGTALGLPGGEPDAVTISPSADRLEILRCIGYQQLRVALHNTTSDHQYGDLFVRPSAPLQASRLQFSSYAPVDQDVGVPIRVTVPPDIAPGDYEVGYQLGALAQASTPVTVSADPEKQCVPPARMTATATSFQGTDVAANAVDGDPATLWRSQAQNLPQSITIDLGGAYDLNEVRYQPRVDGIHNGNITNYRIAVSSDGETFTEVKTGAWSASEDMKSAPFDTPALNVRQVRVTVTKAPGNVGIVGEIIPLGVPVEAPIATATGLNVPGTLVAGKPGRVALTAGNWTDAPLDVDATVDVPDGWTAAPTRFALPPGVETQVNVTVTPPAAEFPEQGVQPELTLTGHVAPVGGGKADGAPTTPGWPVPDAETMTYAFDAGTPTSNLFAGWTRLSPSTPWADGAIAGWVGATPQGRDRAGGSDAIRRDYVYGTKAATLRLVVPPGKQRVAVLRGDAKAESGPLIVKLGGATLVSAGSPLATREFAWERFTLDGGDSGRTVDLELSGQGNTAWTLAALVLQPEPVRGAQVQAEGGVAGSVAPTLSLTLGAPATFGTFLPGEERSYDTSTSAIVTSTAGDAALSASGPVHLRNGAFSLRQPLELTLSRAAWDAPVTRDDVTVAFRQRIDASEPLRTGTYAGTVTFTLATTMP